MRLQIRHDDETGFEKAKDRLLEGFGLWLYADRQLDDELVEMAVSDAEIALDWKFGYDDGHLGRWTTGDVTEFLLRWCPRKLSLTQEDSVTIPGSVSAFISYLAARELLAPGSSPAAAIRTAIEDAAEDFVAEMGNPANFGMAKSLFAGALARGYDLADEASVSAWTDEFNSLSDDEREAILSDRRLAGGAQAAAGPPGWLAGALPTGPALPPVVLPQAEAIEESRASAPVLAMFAKLAEFAGAGRRLTPNGNLSLADARELVRLLGTGDVGDLRVAGKLHPIRSSVDLRVLHLIFTWAKKAGVVRVRHGKVLATKRGLALAANPAGTFDRAVDALLELGPVTVQRHPKAPAVWPEVDRAIDGLLVPLLILPYGSRRHEPLAALADAATQAILAMFTFDRWPDEHVRTYVGSMISTAMDALELAGVVRRADGPGSDSDPAARRPPGEVELTPAGMATVQGLLTSAGLHAPVAGRWADASAEEFLAGADREDWMSFLAEIDAWRQRRTPEQALGELAAAVRHLDDPGSQNVALTIMAEIGPELAAPYIREMASEPPAVRGFALCWLADHDMLETKELYDPGDPDGFAYVLAHRLVTAGDGGLLACLAAVGDEPAQAQVVGGLGKSTASPAGAVLEAIGRSHPAKPVAKAARKALFISRSRAAN